MSAEDNNTDMTSIVGKIEAFAQGHPDISAIYLFGSHAKGHERSKSDVDLGVLFNRDLDGFERVNLETEISNLLKKEVELIDMKKSSPFLCHQIYKHGKTIYQDGTDLAFLFRAASIRDYLDTGHLRKLGKASLYGE
jgi:uncharacterized protein